MNKGFVSVHRKILEWEWYRDNQLKSAFLHCLLKASHKPIVWQGIKIKRGQFITGRKVFAEETGLSEQSVRTCWSKLKSTNELTIKSTNKFSLITVVNFDKYQIKQPSNQPAHQPTINQQPTTYNNINNIDKENKHFKNVDEKEIENAKKKLREKMKWK